MARLVALLIAGILSAAAVADEPKVPRVALAEASVPVAQMNEQSSSPGIKSFFEEMRDLGYVEGKNIFIDRYSGEGKSENLPALARKIVDSRPDVIVAVPSAVARALKTATDDIPIITLGPPTGLKIVTDLDHPGGNVTGVAEFPGDIWAMRFRLLKEIVPSISKIGVMSLRIGSPYEQTMGKAAIEEGVAVIAPLVDTPIDEAQCRRAFGAFAAERVDALLVSDAFQLQAQRALIAELAAKARIPTLYPFAAYVVEGGLVSLALDFPLGWRHAARQLDRIVKGAKPGDLAFVRLDSYLIVVNERAAKTLGLTIPESVRSRAVMRD